MSVKWFGFVAFLLGIQISLFAQESEPKLEVHPDLHFRSFWMSTSYPSEDLKDDYALGMSLNLGVKLTYRQHWRFHLGYRTFANVTSSDIWNPDPTTGQGNRYETGLFDLRNPTDRLFGKLETVSLEYFAQKISIKVGRMGINTDWVNAQDGRLSPTAIEGAYLKYQSNAKWDIQTWVIGKMSIRGSSDWLGIGNTLGIFPVGRNESGTASKYYGNTDSDWLGIVEVGRSLGDEAGLSFSQTLADNLFSTTSLGFETTKSRGEGKWNVGVKGSLQVGVGDGGNPDPQLRYKNPEDFNYAVSGRIGWANSRWTTHLNYTHVGGDGRWLSPREWGKDAWYTFIPRERNEGYGQVDALVWYGEYRMDKVNTLVYAHFGLHWLSDAADAPANKYNFPSYRQLNLGMKYQPRAIKRLDIHVLMTAKWPISSQDLAPIQIYNKVDMLHINAILNWKLN